MKDPMSFQNKGIVIHEVQEIIMHPEETYYNDYALFVLQSPIKMSTKISPICLPLPDEIEDIETESNIITGYGFEDIWYQEYEKLTGRPSRHAKLMNLRLKIPGFEIQKRAVEDFYKIFFEYFPTMELCIENFEFVCTMTDEKITIIMEEIQMNIMNSILSFLTSSDLSAVAKSSVTKPVS